MTTHFEKRHRAASRVALYGGLLVAIALVGIVSLMIDRDHELMADQSWTEVDWESRDDVSMLREYVSIDTSASGSEVDGARFLASHLEAAGIPVEIEELGDSKANLWATLEGDDPEALVLHHHIDVSPPGDLDLWNHPPFEGVIDLPYLIGRGAFDMKSIGIAQLLAMLDLAASGERPRRTVIFLATSSEESGSALGTKWILRNHADRVENFWAVLTEGGVIEPLDFQTIKYWGIEFAQKRFVDGEACHPSRERLEGFKRDARTMNDHWSRARENPYAELFRRAYGPTRAQAFQREVLTQPWEGFSRPENFWRMPRFLRAGFRDEIATFDIEPAPGGGFRLPFVLHLIPGSTVDDARELLLNEWATHDLAITLGEPQGAAYGSPIDHPAFAGVHDAILARFPDTHVGPYFLPWSATDARYFREAGVPAYGFAPFPIFSLETFQVDAPNEQIGLPGFIRGIELYSDVVQRLAGSPPDGDKS